MTIRANNLVTLLVSLVAAPALADPVTPSTPAPGAPPAAEAPEYAWMNGAARPSTLVAGPAIFSLYADSYFQWDVNNPVDHTVFFSSVAPRHNEIGVNLATAGVDLESDTGAYARFAVQAGSQVATTIGRDGTRARGFYIDAGTLDFVREAAVGWHWKKPLHGVSLEAGLLPSYLNPDGYAPGDNWTYTRSWLGDFTPRYLMAVRLQMQFEQSTFEVWLSNGWGTLGEWRGGTSTTDLTKDNLEYGSYGYLYTWRPCTCFSLSHATYAAASSPQDAGAIRVFTANTAQWHYTAGAALSVTGDVGYEFRHTGESGAIAGIALAHHLLLADGFRVGLRADVFYDKTQALVVPLPTGYPLQSGRFVGEGAAVSLDYDPDPHYQIRLEYALRSTNIPYLNGRRGLTGPDGFPAVGYVPDLRDLDQRAVIDLAVRW